MPQHLPVPLPATPPPLPNRVIIGLSSDLAPTDPVPILMPSTQPSSSAMDALTVHYLNPASPTAILPPPAAAPTDDAPVWLQKLAQRVKKLQALAKKLDRIVNPRITTKNFDVKLNLFYHP
ncbi:MAG: hypothetical protein ACYCW6_06980 [Candidatus Xenobia bacterium]